MRVAPDSDVTIVWNGLVLDGDLGADFKLEELQGWDETPEPREDSTDRPAAHGGFDSPVLAGKRRVVAAGQVINPGDRAYLLDQFRAATVLGESGLLAVTLTGQILTAHARLKRARATVGELWSSGVFPWAIEWVCADPLRYGPMVTQSTAYALDGRRLRYPLYSDGAGADVGRVFYGEQTSDTGSLVLVNEGTADTPWVASVAGPVGESGFELVLSGGRRVRYGRGVAAGSTVVLDSATQRATHDGVDATRYVRIRQWEPVPAHGSLGVLFQPLQGQTSAVLTMTHAPAWW